MIESSSSNVTPCSLRHAAGRNHPLHRLAGQLRNALEVCVVVKHRETGPFRGRLL